MLDSRTNAKSLPIALDIQSLGLGLVVLDDKGNIASASPPAERLLQRAGLPLRSYPAPLPQTLSSALRGARPGELRAWYPNQVDGELSIAVSRYTLGVAHELLLLTESSEERQHLSRRLHQQRLETIGRLVASVVHDLRAPLASIVFSIRVLMERWESLSEADIALELATAFEASERLQTTITGLLHHAKLGPPVSDRVDLTEVLTRVRCLLRSAVRERGHTFSFTVGPNAEHVLGEAILVEQILLNLVLNAIEAGPQPILITVECTELSGQSLVELHVRDTGPGIEESVRPRLFEPFFSTKDQGTGLGLTTAREAAIELRGELDALPSTVGAHFVLRLPKAAGEAS